jgi:phosphate transport system substrate-binding protein
MKHLFFILIVFGYTLAACSDNSDNNTQQPTPTLVTPVLPTEEYPTLTLSGPEGSRPMLVGLKMLLESADFGYNITVLTGTDTDSGIRGLTNGALDLLVMMRRPTEDEPVVYTEFVRTTICLLVSSTLPVTDLTHEQVIRIFSGDITNWSEIGGPDQAILVVMQPRDNAITSAFGQTLMQGTPYTTNAQVLPDIQDVIATVRGVPGAIGYGNLFDLAAIVGEDNENSMDIKILTLDGLQPTDSAYPIASSVGIAYAPERAQEMQLIMDWLFGFLETSLGQQYLNRYGVSILEQQ